MKGFVNLIVSWYLTPPKEYCLGPFIKFYLNLLNLHEKLMKEMTMVCAAVIIII